MGDIFSRDKIFNYINCQSDFDQSINVFKRLFLKKDFIKMFCIKLKNVLVNKEIYCDWIVEKRELIFVLF